MLPYLNPRQSPFSPHRGGSEDGAPPEPHGQWVDDRGGCGRRAKRPIVGWRASTLLATDVATGRVIDGADQRRQQFVERGDRVEHLVKRVDHDHRVDRAAEKRWVSAPDLYANVECSGAIAWAVVVDPQIKSGLARS